MSWTIEGTVQDREVRVTMADSGAFLIDPWNPLLVARIENLESLRENVAGTPTSAEILATSRPSLEPAFYWTVVSALDFVSAVSGDHVPPSPRIYPGRIY